MIASCVKMWLRQSKRRFVYAGFICTCFILQVALHTVKGPPGVQKIRNNFQGCEIFRNVSKGWERNWNENSSYVNGNGTGTERVPVADFGTRTELSSTLAERNGTERSSEIFGTDPITGLKYLCPCFWPTTVCSNIYQNGTHTLEGTLKNNVSQSATVSSRTLRRSRCITSA